MYVSYAAHTQYGFPDDHRLYMYIDNPHTYNRDKWIRLDHI